MFGTGDRLHDVRQRPAFHIDLATISYIPLIGPAAWAVYCYLTARAVHGDTSWPDDLTIATACGLSTYNTRRSVEILIEQRLIARHRWTDEEDGLTTFAVMPVREVSRELAGQTARRPPSTARPPADEHADDERWLRETRERNATRELFQGLMEALGVDAGELSSDARSTVTEASRLARAAGATRADIEDMVNNIREDQPDLVLDADRLLDYWSRLFRNADRDEPPA